MKQKRKKEETVALLEDTDIIYDLNHYQQKFFLQWQQQIMYSDVMEKLRTPDTATLVE